MRLMAYLNGKWEKEMEDKMKQVAGEDAKATSSSGASSSSGSGSGASSTSGSKKKGGIFGTIAGALSGVVGDGPLQAVSGFLKIPGVKSVVDKVAGPVMAAGASAFGFPMAAPLLMKFGPQIVDFVGGVADAGAASSSSSGSSGSSGASGTSSSGGSTGSSSSGTKQLSDADRQLLMTEIQRLQDKQKEMFGLVSNILKGNHDTRMAAINNMR